MKESKQTVEVKHPGYVDHKTAEVFIRRREFVAELIKEVIILGNRFQDVDLDMNELLLDAFDFFDDNIEEYGTKAFGDTYTIKLSNLLKLYDKLVEEQLEDLNLSQYEKENGIDVADDSRPAFVVVDRYTTIAEYYDFIDLDALTRNIVNSIIYNDQIVTGELLQ